MTSAAISIKATDDTAAAFAQVKGRLSGLGNEAAAIAGRFAGVNAAIAGVLGGVSLGAYFKQITDGLDALNDLKDATGSSIGNLSALEDVAARTGTSFDTVSSALVKFNGALTGAKAGTEAAEVFKRLGLEIGDLKAQDPAEAFRQTAVALSRFADDGEKARAVQILFGRSTREVAQLLGDLGKAGALNAKVTDEQAAQAEKFNQQLATMAKNSTDAARSIAGPLVEALNQLAEAMKGQSPGGASSISEYITVPLQAVTVTAANVRFVLKGIGTELGGLAAQAAAFARLDFSGAGNIGRALKQDAAAAREDFDRLERRLMNIGRVLPQASYSNEGRRGGERQPASIGEIGKPEKLKAQLDEFDKYLQKLREGLLATQEVSAEEQTRIDINRGLLGVLSEAQQQQALTLASSLDSIRAQQASAKAYAALQDEGRRLTENLRTEQEKLADSLDRANVLVNVGAINWETYGRAITGPLVKAQEEIDKLFAAIPKIGKPLEEINAFARQAGDNIQDALGESVLATLDGSTKRIGDIWKSLLKRMVSQAIAANVGKYLLGESFGKTGEVGGAIGDIFKFFSAAGSARALGGPVQAGRPYLVGERGPEIVVPKTAGTVLPNGTGLAAEPAQQFNVYVQGDASENTVRLIQAAQAQFEARLMSRAR